MANLGLHVDHQFVENLERLGFVFDERVALAVTAQTDAVAQAVHFIEVFLPQTVNRAQDGEPLDFLQRFGIFKADFEVVRLADSVGNEIADGELRRAEAIEQRAGHGRFLAGIGGLENFRLGHADGKVQIHPVGQRAHFPLAEVGVRFRELRDLVHDHLLHDVHEPVAHVVRVNDFVAEAVNDFTLLVHHVVELQRAFADLEIVLLDAFLRLLNGTVQPRMRQFLAFFQAHALHHFHNAVGTEQPHQVILQRNIKVRGTGVALARAAPAQLPVNAARLMTFGGEDVQAAEFGDPGRV